ncbi:VanZ family protein [Planococcus sp. YIM B11945]|uniref:VanZ family protein n=1 Tax=Planococcus sp. YIM B11945 TaxID=3435410 RepID=UPI003D7EDDEE
MQKHQLYSWAAVLLWMALIFTLSHQPAIESSQLSSGITEMVIAVLRNFMSDAREHVDLLQHIVRKNAHFLIYLVLGMLTLYALRTGGSRGIRCSLAAFGICALYAMTDEFHQLFIDGRSGQVSDVLIDSSGALIGIAAFLWCRRLLKANRKKEKIIHS